MLARLLPLVASLLLAAPASAAVREGGVDPPPGPGRSPSEVEHVAVAYDDAAGSVRVTVTFERPQQHPSATLTLAKRCIFGRGIGEGAPDRVPVRVRVAVAWGGSAGYFRRGNILVRDGAEVSADRRTLSGEVRHPLFRGRDLRCVVGFGAGDEGYHDYFGFWFAGYEPTGPPPPYPKGCTPQAAKALAYDAVLPHAAARRPSSYRRTFSLEGWSVMPPLCRDLTGDGDPELLVRLTCCPNAGLGPWAIFTHDETGAWRMAYASVAGLTWSVTLRGGVARALIPAPYRAHCTDTFRVRRLRWTGTRFVSSLSEPRYLGNTHPEC